jgi:hypothetical protein
MPKLRLASADRERLGCPEFLPLDTFSVTNREAMRLQDLGYATPQVWRRALRPKAVEDAAGEATDFVVDYRAWTVLVWLSLARAGVDADPDTLVFDTNFDYIADPEPAAPVVELGKAPGRGRSRTSIRKNSTSIAT